MSKGTEQPPWDARAAFHEATMEVYADLGALIAILGREPDLRAALLVFEEHVLPFTATEPGDPKLVGDLQHAANQLRSSLATAEKFRKTDLKATRIGEHSGAFGGTYTTTNHDALISAARTILDPDERDFMRAQVVREALEPAAWARMKEKMDHDFRLVELGPRPPAPANSKPVPLDVLSIFKEMDFMWMSIAAGLGDDADDAYDVLFGPENFHAQFLALAGRIDELKERFRGDVHKIADFAVTSGHEAAAIFAGRIAQFARARKRWIPQHRQDLRKAEAAGDKVKILRAQHDLREGIQGFAKFMRPAFNGWDEHRAWIRRSIEAELMAANGSQGGAGSNEEAASAKQEEDWQPSAHQQLVLAVLKRDGRLRTGVLWERISPKHLDERAHQYWVRDLVSRGKMRKAGKGRAIEYWLP